MLIIELIVVNRPKDNRRLGNLLANTIVTAGQPAFINGVPVEAEPVADTPKAPQRHPLDD